MAISKGKKQVLKNTPSHTSSDDQASSWMHSLTPQWPYHHPTCSTPHIPDSQTWTAQHPAFISPEQLEAVPSSIIVFHNLKEPLRINILKASKNLEDLIISALKNLVSKVVKPSILLVSRYKNTPPTPQSSFVAILCTFSSNIQYPYCNEVSMPTQYNPKAVSLWTYIEATLTLLDLNLKFLFIIPILLLAWHAALLHCLSTFKLLWTKLLWTKLLWTMMPMWCTILYMILRHQFSQWCTLGPSSKVQKMVPSIKLIFRCSLQGLPCLSIAPQAP